MSPCWPYRSREPHSPPSFRITGPLCTLLARGRVVERREVAVNLQIGPAHDFGAEPIGSVCLDHSSAHAETINEEAPSTGIASRGPLLPLTAAPDSRTWCCGVPRSGSGPTRASLEIPSARISTGLGGVRSSIRERQKRGSHDDHAADHQARELVEGGQHALLFGPSEVDGLFLQQGNEPS